jgi:hypothetical protein
MVVYEIENMETHESGYVQAPTELDMICGLKEKGFTQPTGFEFLAGYNAKGEEVSAMEALFPPVARLKHLNEQSNKIKE